MAYKHLPRSYVLDKTVSLSGTLNIKGDCNIYTRETGACKLNIAVEGHSNAELYSYDRIDGPHGITYMATEPGECLVSIKVNEEYIPYPPFRADICQSIGDAPKISVCALQQKEFTSDCNRYTREAGACKLNIDGEGPSHAELYSYDRRDGPYGIRNSVTKPGECLVVDICQSIGDAPKISVSALQQKKSLQVEKPAALVVDLNNAQGELKAKIVAPSGSEEDAILQDHGHGQYAFEFIPRENGGHNIQLFFNNCGIPERPFRIMVGKEDCGPGMVHASEDDLRTGHIG
ncbi:FLNA [Mytilus edulis]|uniref:FLNA n=1 Tax=Mytilus edulis TaxID=6550 RepID=A0A8S3QI84_MYTED|nr:FLNA [Mytilus edulis]